MGGNMQKNIAISVFCGVIFSISLNSLAEPIDQHNYLNSSQYHLERHQKSWPDGSRYDGEWLQGKPHGQGMFTYADGSQYWGRFHMGKRQGEGMMKYANGDEYEGSWFDDRRSGQGTLRYAGGAVYKGEFHDGAENGKGRMTYANGTYYEGQWLNNVPHGYGRLTFLSGGAYEGQFKQGKPNGKGQYFYANGNLYDGEWKNGQQTGQGRIDYGTGGYYEGSVVDGKRDGKGVLVTALGQRFEGRFVDNEPDGRGECGVINKMAPCVYHHGKRISINRVASTQPKPVAVAQPTTAALITPKVVTPKVVTPKVVTPKVVTLKAVPTKHEPAPNPAAKQFVATLRKEKLEIKTLSIAELNQNRSDLYFTDNSQIRPGNIHPLRAWWKKRSSLLEDQVEIVSQHGNTRIRMLISDYRGPGQYRLKDVEVSTPGKHFEKNASDKASLDIKSEKNGWLSGTFSFQVSSADGQQVDFNNGVFRIARQSRQPYFLR